MLQSPFRPLEGLQCLGGRLKGNSDRVHCSAGSQRIKDVMFTGDPEGYFEGRCAVPGKGVGNASPPVVPYVLGAPVPPGAPAVGLVLPVDPVVKEGGEPPVLSADYGRTFVFPVTCLLYTSRCV